MYTRGGAPAVPQIIWEESHVRMHGGGGEYRFSYDQFGNTYFRGPDSDWWARKYAALMGNCFNVYKFQKVRLPDGSIDYRIRFIAEAGRTITKREGPAAEDCDAIDPLPITDPDRSYVSSMLVNLNTGATDTLVVRRKRPDGTTVSEKNQTLRRNGTFYIFDLGSGEYIPKAERIRAQLDAMVDFLTGLQPVQRAEMEHFIAETVVCIGCLSAIIQEVDEEWDRHIQKRQQETAGEFPRHFQEMLEGAGINTELRENLSNKMDGVLKGLERMDPANTADAGREEP